MPPAAREAGLGPKGHGTSLAEPGQHMGRVLVGVWPGRPGGTLPLGTTPRSVSFSPTPHPPPPGAPSGVTEPGALPLQGHARASPSMPVPPSRPPGFLRTHCLRPSLGKVAARGLLPGRPCGTAHLVLTRPYPAGGEPQGLPRTPQHGLRPTPTELPGGLGAAGPRPAATTVLQAPAPADLPSAAAGPQEGTRRPQAGRVGLPAAQEGASRGFTSQDLTPGPGPQKWGSHASPSFR